MRNLSFCVALLLLLLAGKPALAVEVAAEVVFAAGEVNIEGDGQKRRAATRGGEVRSGELVETGVDGRAQLRFRDGATLSLLPSTRFRVDEYHFSGGTGSAEDKGFFSLLRGGFRTVSGLIGKQFRQQYRVTTPVATIGIRGTAYSAVLGSGSPVLRVQTTQGVVELCTDKGCVLLPVGAVGVVVAPNSPPQIDSDSMAGSGGGSLPSLETPAVTSPGVTPVEKSPPPPPVDSPPAGAKYPGYGR